jgi:hypothetical protein
VNQGGTFSADQRINGCSRRSSNRALGGPKLDVAQEVSRHRRKALADQRASNVVPITRDV